MVASLFSPLNIFILGLGGGFLIPLLSKIGKPWLTTGFFAALAGITIISGVSFVGLLQGGEPIEVRTAGMLPPVSINLHFGLWEGFFTFSVNVVAFFGALHLWNYLRGNYAASLLYLILVMGINGMVMTSDMFNLFVFLEIVSIATYGLFGLSREPAALAAAFKYIMATVIASSLLLLGTVLLYYSTGTLNIGAIIAVRSELSGLVSLTALLMILACLILELKSFPANGWGLDVYETAPTGVAAMVSVGVSSGIFFSLYKLLALFEAQLGIIAISGGVTFLFANLIGLSQTKVRRMLGYSSIAQMGLLVLALALLRQSGADASIPLVIGGLFINHLFAKAGLFWFAGVLKNNDVNARLGLSKHPLLITVFGVLAAAISGLPPFPGFWAKWELIMQLISSDKVYWGVIVLLGSLLEIAYIFRWFSKAVHPTEDSKEPQPGFAILLPVLAMALLLVASGCVAAYISGAASLWLFAPLAAGTVMFLLDVLPGRAKCIIMLTAVLLIGGWMAESTTGIAGLFAALLLAGSLVIASAGLYRSDTRPGFYPLLTILLLSIPAMLRSSTTLEFFYNWEIITLSSCFLIARGPKGYAHLLSFLLFSMGSAFLILVGFAKIAALTGSTDLSAFRTSGPDASFAFVLVALGFLIKSGVAGVHVWLPGSYAEAEDDFTAMLSAVVSKVAIFGLLVGTFVAIRSDLEIELAHTMAWIGMLTIVAGALMALQQNDCKRLLAYSSMSQIGYIIVATALMSHLGWVTALYLVANHLMVKGILFLALAGIILRTGARSFSEMGGLARMMPLTFASVLVAIISMSGLPPLMGFGGKWLLLNAMAEKGWYGLALAGLAATFLGFLYMIRLVYALFLSPAPAKQARTGELPPQLLIPQFILIGAIFLLSFYPKLLIDPISAAIDPYFASTLVWEGMSLKTIYNYWDPTPVVIIVIIVAAILFGLFWATYRTHYDKSIAIPRFARFFFFYRLMLRRMVPPVANLFWSGVSDGVGNIAASLRKLYTGNGQTYAMYVLCYFLALYFAATSLSS